MGRADCPPHVAKELATTTSEATERAKTDDVVEMSPTLVSRITDEVMGEVNEWRNRTLYRLYPIMYMDAIVIEVTELRNRGLEDVLIVGVDGLTGFGDPIEAVWPQATVQTLDERRVRQRPQMRMS